MVVVANTVVNVRTMMIESFNALIANVAVSGSWGSNNFAFWAHI